MAELRFDITGNTSSAQRAVRDLAGVTDVAARGARVLADSLDKQKRAAAASAGATIAAAKADKILADATDEAIASVVAERIELDKDRKAKEENAAATAALATSSQGAAAGASALASPMGALVAAGVALSPVIVTLGFGLAGLGVAAAGVVSPILKAAQSAGGLQANLSKLDPEQRTVAKSILSLRGAYDSFQKSLEPVLLRDFNSALALVAPILKDVQPVAEATGSALAALFRQVGATFRSGAWQQFFGFMSRTAAPDLQLLGQSFTNLLRTLPPLLEQLQPVATDILAIAAASTKLIQAGASTSQNLNKTGHDMSSLQQIATALRLALFAPGVGLYHALQLIGVVGKSAGDGTAELADRIKAAGAATAQLWHPLNATADGLGVWAKNSQQAKLAAQQQAAQVTILTAALKALSGGLLTSEADQVAWKQAQQAATAAIKANTGSLDTNRAAALTARSAIIASTQAALTFANQEVSLHHNTDAASAIIRAQIGWLQTHAGKSRIAAAEVDALRQALAKLKNKAVTLTESGIGHFSISNQQAGGRSRVSSTTSGRGAAAGLFINRGTGPTADDVLIRASKGELIVPTRMVQAGAVDHLRGSIPGFAAGGLAGLPGRTAAFDSQFQARFTAAMESQMTTAMRVAVRAAQAAATAQAFGAGPGGGAPSANAALARRLMPAWASGANWAGWNYVAMRESGWNQFARNPSSGAYGIPQALPPSKMGAAANPPQSNPSAQIRWMIGYINQRYQGSPVIAAQHEAAFNWYDRGGVLPPGVSLAVNNTGQPEQVIGPGSMAQVTALLTQILAAVRIAPAATSAGTAHALNSAARGAMR